MLHVYFLGVAVATFVPMLLMPRAPAVDGGLCAVIDDATHYGAACSVQVLPLVQLVHRGFTIPIRVAAVGGGRERGDVRRSHRTRYRYT